MLGLYIYRKGSKGKGYLHRYEVYPPIIRRPRHQIASEGEFRDLLGRVLTACRASEEFGRGFWGLTFRVQDLG